MILTKNSNRINIHRIAFVASASFLFFYSSIMAYFTSTDETTNRFVGSRFDITLTETKWDAKKGSEVIPGDEIEKNPQVINNERTDAYIFLRVTVPGAEMLVDNNNGTAKESTKKIVPLYKFIAGSEVNSFYSDDQSVNSPWKAVTEQPVYDSDNKQYIYVYYYSTGTDEQELRPLKKGETTEALFDKLQLWNFNEEFDPTGTHLSQNVRVEALGIQTDLPGLTAKNITEVWKILSEGGG